MNFEPRVVILAGEEVILDPSKLEFNEASLGGYLESEARWYNYFAEKLADAEYLAANLDHEYKTKYAEVFKTWKAEGFADKWAERNTDVDKDVHEAKKRVTEAERTVSLINNHLKAWDKNHRNAQSRGYMLQKELDKLGSDIYYKKQDNDLEARINDIIGEANSQSG